MDNLANCISQIKIGLLTQSTFVEVAKSKKVLGVMNFLYDLGFISGVEVNRNKIKLTLNYGLTGVSPIKDIVLVDKGSRRGYITLPTLKKEINKNRGVVFVVSTIKGLRTGDEAVAMGVGGVLILKI